MNVFTRMGVEHEFHGDLLEKGSLDPAWLFSARVLLCFFYIFLASVRPKSVEMASKSW